ncbi:LOB domain-containing protein 17 [Syzygium oleosum]|uniref:LOB domain-containing protein 17 n=1 Tax=Syzygium oleosum TaxID=219896 RepID=UPI0011D19BF9|nr:LOB domain-containing protein 17 [Syzygium oleosum]
MHRPINNGIGGAHAACASCKHQRKKCDDKCVLSPYFPAEKSAEFQAVHKVFGVSNVTKMVLGVCEEDRRRLADSLVWEARLRQQDPVHGAFGEYQRIQNELQYYKSLCQKQVIQSQHLQGELSKRSHGTARSFGGWNNKCTNAMACDPRTSMNTVASFGGGGGVVHGTAMNNTYTRDSGSCIIDSIPYQGQSSEDLNQEREIASGVPLQQHGINGFNQLYFMSGNLPHSSFLFDSPSVSTAVHRENLDQKLDDNIHGWTMELPRVSPLLLSRVVGAADDMVWQITRPYASNYG